MKFMFMKVCYILFFTILSLGVYSCIPRSAFPIFVPPKNKEEAYIIKSDRLNMFLVVSGETIISDTNYIIPVDIVISNYMNDTLHIKIKDIRAYLTTNKNEIFEGVVEKNIDTVITNLEKNKNVLPFVIEFKTFNSNCIKSYLDMRNLEIIIPEIIINKTNFPKKNAFFLCK